MANILSLEFIFSMYILLFLLRLESFFLWLLLTDETKAHLTRGSCLIVIGSVLLDSSKLSSVLIKVTSINNSRRPLFPNVRHPKVEIKFCIKLADAHSGTQTITPTHLSPIDCNPDQYFRLIFVDLVPCRYR